MVDSASRNVSHEPPRLYAAYSIEKPLFAARKVCYVLSTRCDGWQNLTTTTSVAENCDFLVFQVNVPVPLSRMPRQSFESDLTGNVRILGSAKNAASSHQQVESSHVLETGL